MNGAYGSSKLTAGGRLDEESFLDDEALDCQSNEELINSPTCRPTKMSNHAGSLTVHFSAPSKTLAGQSHKILKEEKSEIDQSSNDLEQIYSDHNYPAMFREEDFRTKNVNSYSNRINERLENDQLFSTSKKRTGMKNELEFTKTRANFEKNEKATLYVRRINDPVIYLYRQKVEHPMSIEPMLSTNNCTVDTHMLLDPRFCKLRHGSDVNEQPG
ncbi:hypothetical protein HELRODRAFT_181274 [Helobdella robusta]|uniref:Uncharacterized protein n=1 Tax=Helobdella robusta TaxID=6412 RepID=T1FGU1_HELRO|nr:hypothetical protein HELRODRAFT_181274 [Helobdella robusta]ESN93165.1 hypothetical protein HELRODRAFT_181274 [Helobdella robusta]